MKSARTAFASPSSFSFYHQLRRLEPEPSRPHELSLLPSPFPQLPILPFLVQRFFTADNISRKGCLVCSNNDTAEDVVSSLNEIPKP